MNKLKGILICFIIGLFATFLGNKFPIIGGAVFAVLIGMILSSLINRKVRNSKEGINFTAKKILQYAVILLGFSMNLNTIFDNGKSSLPVIISTILIALISAYLLTIVLNIDRKIGVLIGVGSSICGGSAIAATAPIIKASDEEVAKSISVIFLFNVLAALIFPTLGSYLGFSNQGFGLFAGTAVNDTSSVTAAASSWDAIHNSNILELATVVKLTRTLAIIPITLVLSLYEGKKNNENKLRIKSLIPNFIILFILASVLTTFLPIPKIFITNFKILSKFFITMAMAAIGINTNMLKLIKTGGKPIFLGFICWVFISITSIFVQYLIGIY